MRANVREPVQVEGDLFSLMACNDKGSERLREMMGEFGIDSIEPLADHIFEHSHAATLEADRKLPAGTYHNSVIIDGYDHPIELKAALTISKAAFTSISPAPRR